MSLNDNQIDDLWQRIVAAETRALYFADVSNCYATTRQIITGISFFLSSGAAATIIAKAWVWVPVVLSTIVALTNAYSFSISLDRKIGTAVKLHSQWHKISNDYENLWNSTYANDASEQFEKIVASERELSELATTEMPKPDWERLERWRQNVLRLHYIQSEQ